MINPQAIFEKVKALLDIPAEDEIRLQELCTFSAETLSKRLRDGFSGGENEVIYGCAAFAVYRYAILKSCDDASPYYLKTGDITVQRSASSLLESAEKLILDAFSQSDCFTDTNFIFRGM